MRQKKTGRSTIEFYINKEKAKTKRKEKRKSKNIIITLDILDKEIYTMRMYVHSVLFNLK